MGKKDIYRLAGCSVELGGKMVLAPQEYSIAAGEFVTFSGRSGAGKSTLLQLLLGFIRPTAGRLFFKGADVNESRVRQLREAVAVVFQEPVLMGRTIEDALLEPFYYKRNHRLKPSFEKIEKILNKLDVRIGTESVLSTLSGGEKQRIALARALLMEREVLLLDEVTSALDDVHRKLVFEVIADSGATVIAVSHDSQWIENSPRNIIITAPVEIGVR